MAVDIATTSNYASVAIADDVAVETEPNTPRSSTPTTSNTAKGGKNERDPVKVAAREARIAEAVKRSRDEYKTEHAYTERQWFREDDSGASRIPVRPKMDRQQLEYLVTSLYYSTPPQYQNALDLVLRAFDSTAKSLGGLNRELLDTGIRCALQVGATAHAVELANATRSLWRNWAGSAGLAADAFSADEQHREAVEALLTTTSMGIHVPSLQKLDHTLGLFPTAGTRDGETNIDDLRHLVRQVANRRVSKFQRPLFDDRPLAEDDAPVGLGGLFIKNAGYEASIPEANLLASTLGLSEEGSKDLEKTIGRLRRAVAGGGEADVDPPERSVREL